MLKPLVAFVAGVIWAVPAIAARNDPFAAIQDPMVRAVIQQYLDILAENPKLQQQVISCALTQISNSPEAQKILTVDPARPENSVDKRYADLKTTLVTVKAVFQPCLDMMNSGIRIE